MHDDASEERSRMVASLTDIASNNGQRRIGRGARSESSWAVLVVFRIPETSQETLILDPSKSLSKA